MRASDQIPELDGAGLRRFGLIMAGIVAGLFGLLLPMVVDYAMPLWPFAVAGVFCGWSLGTPRTLIVVYRPWMRLGLVLNRIVTPVIMSVVFFVLITPVSLIMKIIGRDPLARGFDPDAESYRQPSRKPSREHLERPF